MTFICISPYPQNQEKGFTNGFVNSVYKLEEVRQEEPKRGYNTK